MFPAIRRTLSALSALWRASGPPPTVEVDDVIRERLAELTLPEAIALARVTALRDGERQVAAALQSVLLLHLTGGSLAPVADLVCPGQSSQVVN